MALRHPDTLRHLTIEDCFEVDGAPTLLLSDGTVLTIWCDEEQNGPGALYAHRWDGDVRGSFALIHKNAPEPSANELASQRISSLAMSAKREVGEQLDRMLALGDSNESANVVAARRLLVTHRGPRNS